MLDLRNEELAKLWLSLRPASVSAAIYFDDADEMMVLDCRDIAEPLLLSPFKYQIDKCVFIWMKHILEGQTSNCLLISEQQ